MDEIEVRGVRVGYMFTALGLRASPEEIAAYVQETARIPVPWLGAGIKKLVIMWDKPTKPKPKHIFDQAWHAAGFRPYTTPCETVTPSYLSMKWWPPAGQTAPRHLADKWHDTKAALLLTAGKEEDDEEQKAIPEATSEVEEDDRRHHDAEVDPESEPETE